MEVNSFSTTVFLLGAGMALASLIVAGMCVWVANSSFSELANILDDVMSKKFECSCCSDRCGCCTAPDDDSPLFQATDGQNLPEDQPPPDPEDPFVASDPVSDVARITIGSDVYEDDIKELHIRIRELRGDLLRTVGFITEDDSDKRVLSVVQRIDALSSAKKVSTEWASFPAPAVRWSLNDSVTVPVGTSVGHIITIPAPVVRKKVVKAKKSRVK